MVWKWTHPLRFVGFFLTLTMVIPTAGVGGAFGCRRGVGSHRDALLAGLNRCVRRVVRGGGHSGDGVREEQRDTKQARCGQEAARGRHGTLRQVLEMND